MSLANDAAISIAADDWRDWKARAIGGDKSSRYGVGPVVAASALIDAEGDNINTLAQFYAWGCIDADCDDKKSNNGGELHSELRFLDSEKLEKYLVLRA